MGINLGILVIVVIIVFLVGILSMITKCYRKVEQGSTLIRNGLGGSKVDFEGMLVFPVLHRLEVMDVSVKRIEIERRGRDGLICGDNLRADIKVAFFVRVNHTVEAVLKVAQSLGAERASDRKAIVELFDAKFSEALKTVGKKFKFVELYEERTKFKEEILQVIGTDLNGYVLDDCAIDYLEQTSIEHLSAENILDSEGIKTITELTAVQKVLANQIERERQKTIKRQDVEAEEAILEMDRQLAESREKQRREIATISAREAAETMQIQQEERLKAESARIRTEEELSVAEENKLRQIIVAQKNKQRTEFIETERIEKDRQMEVVERERTVTLATIERDRAVEVEQKNIQEVIRERVAVERVVVEEKERIKDTEAFAGAEREKKVALTLAEQAAQEALILAVKAAEAKKQAAEMEAQQKIIEAEASQKASDKNAEARKMLAEAQAAEEAAKGMAEAQVLEANAAALEKKGLTEARILAEKALAQARGIEANAVAHEKQGEAEANVLRKKAVAEATGTQARAIALQKEGEAEATVLLKKYQADAQGLREKADAMKLLDGVGREHEEFKLRLHKEKEVELAQLKVQQEIAQAQAAVISEGLKTAKIEIIGGESVFFDKLLGAVTQAKSIDRLVAGSETLSDVKNTFFNGDPEHFKKQLKTFVSQFGMTSEDLKNLSVSALLAKLAKQAGDDKAKGVLGQIKDLAERFGLGHLSADDFK